MIHFLIVGVLVLGSTYALYTYVLTNDILLPVGASQQAVAIDELFQVHWFFISFFLSLIVVFILYSVIVFRRKKGEQGDGAYFEGNTPLEIAWTIIPLGIVLFLAYRGAQTLGDVELRKSDAIEISVVAQQWAWRFDYPDGFSSDKLVLPEGKQILLRLHSEDVIHSFWVPEFRVKQDVLPGGEDFVRELRITPNQQGTFKVRCAELCGSQHYAMRADVVVMDPAGYADWVLEQTGTCELSDAECGQKWATQYGCLACHSTDGTKIVGPTWLDLFGHQVLLNDGTTVMADENYLHNSIMDPNMQVVAEFSPDIMPGNFSERLTDEQIAQIIAFIQSLSK
jgi:cytochrome c oxidase subunit 2